MMRSATDFLPDFINTLTNLATSWLPNFGSGRISRFCISLRRGIKYSPYAFALSRFWTLCTVFGTALLAVFHALRIQAAAHHVVTHTRQILYPAAADQHYRVLL